MSKDRKPKLPRVPLPRQTGGFHRPDKGRGAYKRSEEKQKWKKEDK
ncbi:MAG: hypothetical protein KW788_01450 [Candidatus Doudnabacteria bacterium]|nr:hypothetical protein [Candidatus Doudnabacteria bacterium]